MSFNVALSGLNAASTDLQVISNNIANVNTTGFKGSRSEFGDLFAVSAYYGASTNSAGSGVQVARIAQDFGQGAINFTQKPLDLAVSGDGFFVLSDSGSMVYSRNGAFGTDKDGYVVNASGQRLQVFPPVGDGSSFDTAQMSDLQLRSADNPPSATATVDASLNLPADASVPAVTPFDAADPTSYNHTTSMTVYDSLGVSHTANFYFIKTANPNEWEMQAQIDGTAVGAATPLVYSDTGELTSPAGGSVALSGYTPGNGAAAMDVTLDLSDSTQYGESFSVSSLNQDGYATGRITGLEITEEGVVQARYTNGQVSVLGQLAMASFPNPQGLQQLGNAGWGESYAAGQRLIGSAGSGSFGQIQSGALESSNVELTAQLVNMITAQRNFQANAQMISTADQITQTIINIR